MTQAQQAIIDADDIAQKQSFISRFMRLSGKWLVTLKPHKPVRSLRQNAYLWGVVYATIQSYLASHDQYVELEEIHEGSLAEHAPKTVQDPLTGAVMWRVGQRSSKMTVEQFSQYIDCIRAWWFNRFDLYIPTPQDFNVKAYVPAESRAA
jgi:hypothetical protein